jgi:hypothetical protein
LTPLPLRDGAERVATLYLILTEGDAAGPGARRLAELLRAESAEQCAAALASQARAPAARKAPRRRTRD